MPRIVKESEYIARRNEILDAAYRLIFTKGYAQMTIQDILDQLQISKGAFYHYFDSKGDLLEAMIERLKEEAMQALMPILQDPNLPAIEKLERYFDSAARWKSARREFFMDLLRVWYTDDNALVRQKTVAGFSKQFQSILAAIIQQGNQEGVLQTPDSMQAAEVASHMLIGLSDAVGMLLLCYGEPHDEDQRIEGLQRIGNTIAAYTGALERILGASPGSLKLVDVELIGEWMTSTGVSVGKELVA